jgi:hypothetical protein
MRHVVSPLQRALDVGERVRLTLSEVRAGVDPPMCEQHASAVPRRAAGGNTLLMRHLLSAAS